MCKKYTIIAVAVIAVLAFSQYHSLRSISQGIHWNYYTAKKEAEYFLSEYKDSLSITEKRKLLLDFKERNFEHLKAIEVMSKHSIVFRKYYIKGFADDVLLLESEYKDSVVEKEGKQVKAYCEKFVEIE